VEGRGRMGMERRRGKKGEKMGKRGGKGDHSMLIGYVFFFYVAAV